MPDAPPRLAALILTAGQSRRFGSGNKLLADLEGRPVLCWTVEAVTHGCDGDLLIVTGEDHAALTTALSDVPARFVPCASVAEGMGTSIAAGMAALEPWTEGVLIVPGDMPLLRPSGIRRMCEVFGAHGRDHIVYAATRDGAQRNPVLWPARDFADLARLSGPQGAKMLLMSAGPRAIPVAFDDERDLADIDDRATLTWVGGMLRQRLQA